MSNEKQYLFSITVNSDRLQFSPYVNQYEFVRETNSYYYVKERGSEVKFHKNNVKLRFCRTIEEAQELVRAEKQRVLDRLAKRRKQIEDRTSLYINEVDSEPFTLDEDIKI